jgi:cell division protein ZapB
MDTDLSSLEAKVEQVVAFCQALRTENLALRERVAVLEHDKLDLAARMNTARERLETMMESLPAE